MVTPSTFGGFKLEPPEYPPTRQWHALTRTLCLLLLKSPECRYEAFFVYTRPGHWEDNTHPSYILNQITELSTRKKSSRWELWGYPNLRKVDHFLIIPLQAHTAFATHGGPYSLLLTKTVQLVDRTCSPCRSRTGGHILSLDWWLNSFSNTMFFLDWHSYHGGIWYCHITCRYITKLYKHVPCQQCHRCSTENLVNVLFNPWNPAAEAQMLMFCNAETLLYLLKIHRNELLYAGITNWAWITSVIRCLVRCQLVSADTKH